MSLKDRYAVALEGKTKKGKRYYASILYPDIPNRLDDIYLQVNTEDRLDVLAYQYYGDSRLWWIIATANNLGKGTMSIPDGVIRIRVPQQTSDIFKDYVELNKTR